MLPQSPVTSQIPACLFLLLLPTPRENVLIRCMKAAGEKGREARRRDTVLAVPTGLVTLHPLCQHLFRRVLDEVTLKGAF